MVKGCWLCIVGFQLGFDGGRKVWKVGEGGFMEVVVFNVMVDE